MQQQQPYPVELSYGNSIFDAAVKHLRSTVSYYYESLVKNNGQINYVQLILRLEESVRLLGLAEISARRFEEGEKTYTPDPKTRYVSPTMQVQFLDNIDEGLKADLLERLGREMVVHTDLTGFDPRLPAFAVVQSSTNRYVAEVRESKKYNKSLALMLQTFPAGVNFIWLSPKGGSTIGRSTGPMGEHTAFVPFKINVVSQRLSTEDGAVERSIDMVKSLIL